MSSATTDERLDVLVVGGGQAGLGTAFHLRRSAPRTRTLVVEAEDVGGSWERRWDSLRLFTPRRYTRLPGLDFPVGPGEYPDRLEMAAYLRAYAVAHRLPVRERCRVQRLEHLDETFVAHTDHGVLTARQVVIAAGPFTLAYLPAFADDLGAGVHQVHSAQYRRPRDLPPGPVAVVGGGNSAAQLAVELADAGRSVHLIAPREPWYLPERVLGCSVYSFLGVTGALNANADSFLARYIRRRGDVIVGTTLRRRIAAGEVALTISRAVAARPGALILADAVEVPVAGVLWCTGYRADTSWIDISGALTARGEPGHRHGAGRVEGLHWMGLPWQTRLNSSLVHGVDRDAATTARRVRRLA